MVLKNIARVVLYFFAGKLHYRAGFDISIWTYMVAYTHCRRAKRLTLVIPIRIDDSDGLFIPYVHGETANLEQFLLAQTQFRARVGTHRAVGGIPYIVNTPAD